MVESPLASTDPPSGIWDAKKLAEAVCRFEKHDSGRTPESAAAVLMDDSLVITLRGILSPAELEQSQTPEGAAQVIDLRQQHFLVSCSSLRQEIEAITGVPVLNAALNVVAQTGTAVYVIQLANAVAASTWTESKRVPGLPNSQHGTESRDLGGEG